MNLHSLKNSSGARHRRKRVGRGMGSGRGKTCGAGHKGQLARKGHKRKIGFEGGQMRLIRRLPKVGFKAPTHQEYRVVNVGSLELFADGTEVTPDLMREKDLVRGPVKGDIKILGDGTLSHRLTVKAQAFSASARSKIEAAGGTCEILKN